MAVRMRSTVLAAVLALVAPMVVQADTPATIPVLLRAPTCEHQKLGSVSIDAGHRISETTSDMNLPAVDYSRAFARLATAATAKGANAVVISWHQAAYFTRFGRRSHKPVYLRLEGRAIRYQGAAGECRLAVADPEEFARRAQNGKPVNVTSDQMYSED